MHQLQEIHNQMCRRRHRHQKIFKRERYCREQSRQKCRQGDHKAKTMRDIKSVTSVYCGTRFKVVQDFKGVRGINGVTGVKSFIGIKGSKTPESLKALMV